MQVDSSFTYAYTLCGHEFMASEKIDKVKPLKIFKGLGHQAVAMYENALNLDPRHYNAWWGLGNIYHRQEEHELLGALRLGISKSKLSGMPSTTSTRPGRRRKRSHCVMC